MIRNLKHLLIHNYVDFYEKEYLSVLNSFRIVLSIIFPLGFYVYTKDENFVWLGLCCFLWALHIYAQNKAAFFLKKMFLSLAICTALQILGFFAHVNIVTYCFFSFLIAFLIPFSAYFKQVVLYDISVYFIVQGSSFFEKDMMEMTKSVIYSILAFFIVILIGNYGIRVNPKKQMMYRLKVNLNYLLDYLEDMKEFLLVGTKKNYEELGYRRGDMFRSIQIFRDIYPTYTVSHPNDVFAKIAPIQERFIETTIGFCVQIRNIHVTTNDSAKIKQMFKRLRDAVMRQRGLIFEAQTLTVHELLVRYQNIFLFVKNIEPISNQDTHLTKKELAELNSAISQFKDSITLMEKDIQKTLLTI